MKKNVLFAGISAIMLVFGLVLTACGDNGGGDPYKLSGGYLSGLTYSGVSSQFTANGAPLVPAGSNAGYLTGSDAKNVYDRFTRYVEDNNVSIESITATGTFEDLINYQSNGIGLPEGLKAALTAQQGNMPLASVFEVSSQGVVVLYVEAN
jgi:hypothetical protein